MALLTSIVLSGGNTLHLSEQAAVMAIAYDEVGNPMGAEALILLKNGVLFTSGYTDHLTGEITWTWTEDSFVGEQVIEARMQFPDPTRPLVISKGVVFTWVPPGVATIVLLSAAGAPTNPVPGSVYYVFVSVFDQNRVSMQGQHVFLLSGINGGIAATFREGDTNEYGFISFSWTENVEIDQYLQAWVGSVSSSPITLSWRNAPPPPPFPIPACLQLLPSAPTSAAVGTQVAISVLVLDQFGVLCGQPIAGWQVRIIATRVDSNNVVTTILNRTVNAGPDGYARLTYSAPTTGTDHIIAFADTGQGRFVYSNVGTMTWTAPTCPAGQYWNGSQCVANPAPGPGPRPGGTTNIILIGGAIMAGIAVALILYGGQP